MLDWLVRRFGCRDVSCSFCRVLLALLAAFTLTCLATLVVVVLFAASPARAEAKASPLVLYSHRSNLFRGEPFNDREDSTEDFLCAGATIAWRGVELDLCHGAIARDCNYVRSSLDGAHCVVEQGSMIVTRWYPGRARRGLR